MPRRRKSPSFTFFTLAVLVFMALVLALALWQPPRRSSSGPDYESNFTLYPGFGLYLPNGYRIHGIDVSRYQSRINWALVKKMRDNNVEVGFAFIKATEGGYFTDPQFSRNWQNSRRVGLTRGAYLFFRAGGDGKRQAHHFIDLVTLRQGDLPPVVDVETLNNASAGTLIAQLADCLETLERHYGVKPILYSNATFYNTYLHSYFGQYPLWVAHYFELQRPRVNRHWHFWQHAESGRVNGINGFVDFNVFNGDSTDFEALLVK
jgi:lysozyme